MKAVKVLSHFSALSQFWALKNYMKDKRPSGHLIVNLSLKFVYICLHMSQNRVKIFKGQKVQLPTNKFSCFIFSWDWYSILYKLIKISWWNIQPFMSKKAWKGPNRNKGFSAQPAHFGQQIYIQMKENLILNNFHPFSLLILVIKPFSRPFWMYYGSWQLRKFKVLSWA